MNRRSATLETGNAGDAGAASRGWFVGDLAAWAASRGRSFEATATPRQSAHLQVKWFAHPPGDVRPAWSEPDECFSLSVLVDGDARFDFRDGAGAERSVRLARRGDYVLWHGPTYAHSWSTDGGCTLLTVRWPEGGAADVFRSPNAPWQAARSMHPRAAELIATLDLRPHPEGGFYRELHRSTSQVAPADGRGARAALTTIYFLLPGDTASRWHRVASDEVWHLYEGGPLELLELDEDARHLMRHRLGPVGDGDAAPVCTIAAGAWQAARALGDYVLVGCTVGPGFDFADFTMLADDPALASIVRRAWPEVASLI